jgi:arylsulfatase A-like enzyme/Flp pilus assembly protein TadD
MRTPTAVIAILLAAVGGGALCGPGDVLAEPQTGKPNFLLITIDTLRPDRLGCYGSRTVETPSVDGLAGQGVLFERAFSHAPLTLPAHASIMLGLLPPTHGVRDNANFRVPDGFLTLAEWLKRQGYETGAVVGAFPLDSRFGLTRGFDLYDDNYGSQGESDLAFVERKAGVVVERALAWIRERNGPWFLWVHCFDPHQKYHPPEPFLTRYKDAPYDGEVAYVDSELGKLFSGLKSREGPGGTVVAFTADHGESLGDHGETTHGYFAYNATIHVPLIIAAPGLAPRRVGGNVSHVDIFPTVCDALGIQTPPGLEGVSFWPAARGKDLVVRPVYFEAMMPFYSRGWAPLQGYIEGNTKYIESPIPEVYDLDKDFQELRNLADGPILASHRRRFVELTQALPSTPSKARIRKVDREAQEKLRSLGYVAGPRTPAKKTFTEEDDLKVLLPFQEKWAHGVGAYEAGRVAEGIKLLKEVITKRPDFELAYTYLANFYKNAGRLEDAVTVLKAASETNPASYTLGTAYGAILLDAGRDEEALDVLDRATAIIDFDPDAWNYKGVALTRRGAYDKALAAYGKALELDDNSAIVFNNIGSLHLSVFLKNGNAESLGKATAGFRRAISLDPGYASAYNGLGAVLKMGGDIESAIEAWKKAVELKPGFGFPLYNLGLALMAKGDKAQALGYFRRYKNAAYDALPEAEKVKLDSIIAACEK